MLLRFQAAILGRLSLQHIAEAADEDDQSADGSTSQSLQSIAEAAEEDDQSEDGGTGQAAGIGRQTSSQTEETGETSVEVYEEDERKRRDFVLKVSRNETSTV